MSVTFDRLLAIDHQDIYRTVLSYLYPYPIVLITYYLLAAL